MEIKIPELALVVLIGASGSGKSVFARNHFLETETLSSDRCRAIVSDNETNQHATADAFDILFYIARKRLNAGRLTVIDATNVQRDARKPLIRLAREFHVIPVAIVLDLPGKTCKERTENRSDRKLGPHVIPQQRSQLRRSFRGLKKEGFRRVYRLESEEDVDNVTIVREPMWNDKSDITGPFDLIGDVHGCLDELEELLEKLGYRVTAQNRKGPVPGPVYSHPDGRTAVFLGDIVDRGPRILDCLKLVYNMVNTENALCVPGNHDMKFMRKLKGRKVQVAHGLEKSLAEVDALPEENRGPFTKEIAVFLDRLISHYVLDRRKLVAAHAGLKEEMQGRGSGQVRDFCLYGETTGETDEFGLPVRLNWAAGYRGNAVVVYGHTPIPEPEWLNNTVNIDTGCVFGGKLTALSYPELEFTSVPARKVYTPPVKPLVPEDTPEKGETLQQKHDDLLDAEDVLGKSILSTRLRPNITVREENAAAALEVMSRFAANPKWLIYLPPTMSPSESSKREGYLEYPEEAFAYFRSQGITRVICEEKHMGSRAVVVLCKDETAARERFGVVDEGTGIVYTRTGRRFFNDPGLETEFLKRTRDALQKAGVWDEFDTDWVCLDCELMPWSEKALELLRAQYAAVGAAGTASMAEAGEALTTTAGRKDLEETFKFTALNGRDELDIRQLLEKYRERSTMVSQYIDAYRNYCWTVNSIDDYKLAPFHFLASENNVHTGQNHEWHMKLLSRVCESDPALLLATPYKVIDVTDPQSTEKGMRWWEELTEKGGEGMVVKPLDFIARGKRGLVQPAVKCRGREYLRIIYSPEYTLPEHLERLRSRGLGTKRSLAIREFALGVESLERFVKKEPLRRVHECVFGILALESEPIDPRL